MMQNHACELHHVDLGDTTAHTKGRGGVRSPVVVFLFLLRLTPTFFSNIHPMTEARLYPANNKQHQDGNNKHPTTEYYVQ